MANNSRQTNIQRPRRGRYGSFTDEVYLRERRRTDETPIAVYERLIHEGRLKPNKELYSMKDD